MTRKDVSVLALTLVAVLILVGFAALAPVYRMPDGTFQRHWVWNAPTMPVGHGYDDMTPQDIARLSADPAQRKILEDMQNMPRSIPISPIYIGSKYSPGRNSLGYAALIAVVSWSIFAIHKWTS